ncbi:MAG: transcriptional repressor, partial [Pseudanabaenaceae cyanobacterium bins.68]|nr:transcriptional repressor [Pseudanabaenaceae cyanobacterium bins.68]
MDAIAITTTMKSKGLRITPQRFAVYANLLSRCDHPTVEQILIDLNQQFAMTSRATIYSTLAALTEVDLVRQVWLEDGIARFDANVQPHHHFCCRRCQQITDIPWQVFASPNLNLLNQGLR